MIFPNIEHCTRDLPELQSVLVMRWLVTSLKVQYFRKKKIIDILCLKESCENEFRAEPRLCTKHVGWNALFLLYIASLPRNIGFLNSSMQ